MSKLKKLYSFSDDLAEIKETERSITERHRTANARLTELRDVLDRAILDGKVGVDFSTTDESVEKAHADIPKLEPIASDDALRRQREKLQVARGKVESDTHQFAVENLSKIKDELGEMADALTALFTAWWTGTDAVSFAELQTRHAALARAYSVVERAADLGRHTSTRLDIPPLPISITGDVAAPFIPYSIAEQTDPTIRSAPIPTA